jgi:hypothetical protein
MSKLITIILVSTLLFGCGITPQRVDPNQPILRDEGFVLMSVYCEDPVPWVMIHKPEVKTTWGNSVQQVSCGDVLIAGDRNVVKLFALPEGEYVIGSYLTNKMRMYNQTLYKVNIKAGVVNYIGRVEVKSSVVIGDLNIPGRLSKVDVFYKQQVSLVDNEEKDKLEIVKHYPSIFNKRQYKKQLAIKM